MALYKANEIDLVKDHSYSSDKMEEVARAINDNDLWERTDRNYSEIGRILDCTPSHVRNTIYSHFAPDGKDKTFEQIDKEKEVREEGLGDVVVDPESELGQLADGDGNVDLQDLIPIVASVVQDAYRDGYNEGRRDMRQELYEEAEQAASYE